MVTQRDHIQKPTNGEFRLLSRRPAIKLIGGTGLALIAGCATGSVVTTTAGAAGSTTSTGATATTFGGAGSCVLIPEETAGPLSPRPLLRWVDGGSATFGG